MDDPIIVIQWIGGGVAAFVLLAVVVRIFGNFTTEYQQRTTIGAAVGSGLVISFGISPFGELASELAQFAEVVPAEYPEWIKALVSVDTVLGILYGFSVMWASGGLVAVGSFVLALLGGLLLAYSLSAGVLLIIFAWILMEFSPAERW